MVAIVMILTTHESVSFIIPTMEEGFQNNLTTSAWEVRQWCLFTTSRWVFLFRSEKYSKRFNWTHYREALCCLLSDVRRCDICCVTWGVVLSAEWREALCCLLSDVRRCAEYREVMCFVLSSLLRSYVPTAEWREVLCCLLCIVNSNRFW